MNKINEILLRRKNKILYKKKTEYFSESIKEEYLFTIMRNIEELGYTFSKHLFNSIKNSGIRLTELGDFQSELIELLKRKKGDDKVYTPMYPNFPYQVMNSEEIELYKNALFHYWSRGEWIPDYIKTEREVLQDSFSLEVLEVGTDEELMDIFKNLLLSKTSLSKQDREDMEWFILNCSDFYEYFPESIPLKENVAFIGTLILKNGINISTVEKYFKTATDVLRLITCMSDGDISLSINTRYKSLKRGERKIIMNLLANCNNLEEDMFRYKQRWIRIGEIIHPNEYKNEKYKEVIKCFQKLRGNNKPKTWRSKVEKAVLNKDIKTATDLLIQRPGEFARMLDKLLRECNDDNASYVVDAFKRNSEKVALPVLLQVREHFWGRLEDKKDKRIFLPKGCYQRIKIIDNNLKEIKEEYSLQVIQACVLALKKQCESKPYMGKVYIDENLKKYLVPFSQRTSNSYKNKFLVRGSRIQIEENKNIIRGFIWWTNKKNDDVVDLDLSLSIYGESWDYMLGISYGNLRNHNFNIYHSGDIIDGGDPNGDGAAEFIDFDIKSIVKNGGRYAVFQIYSFSGHEFAEIPCRFGWMVREKSNSGEIFEPKTVIQNIDLISKSRYVMPVVFDCIEKEFIWCDIPLKTRKWYGNNLEGNIDETTRCLYGMLNMRKPDLYTLITINAMARGSIVKNKDGADIIFSVDKEVNQNAKNVTAFDTDYIIGDLL